METHKRSLAKAISYRVIGSLYTMVLILLFSGSLTVAGLVGLTEGFTKVFLYWLHERAWQRIPWGGPGPGHSPR
jgi:uncharacterized membrane protein